MTTTTPRPPEGDLLGTPYLSFTREGPFGVCTLDRPEARNAMTPAMYFGIRYAVRHVDADPTSQACSSPAPVTCSHPVATWAAATARTTG